MNVNYIKSLTLFLVVAGACLLGISCNKAMDQVAEEIPENEFDFGVNSDTFETKAQEATSIASFKAESTQGNAGSETNASPCWINIVFASDGQATPTYKATPAKYWPRTNPNYNFYGVAARSGSNGAADAATAPNMTFGASGTTISLAAGDNNKDVVCAYLPKGDVTYRTKNTLTFEHIYARVSTVNITADALYDMTDITIKIKNVKTGGVYNLRTGCGQTDGTGWSSKVPADGTNPTIFTRGEITRGNNYTGVNNDLYVVPGEYKLLATWTATNDDYTQTFTDKESANTVHLVGGKVNSITGALTGNGMEITYSVVLNPWGSNVESGVSFPILDLGSFAGLNIAPAPLYYNGSTFEIKDADWNHDSYGSYYGKNSGSYYFNFVELGSYFDSRGNSFNEASGNINNNSNKITCGGYNDWRVPTQAEWASIIGSSRAGSSVNGTASCRYALIQLSNIFHAGNANPLGLLLIPDGKTITGMSRTFTWNTASTSGNTGVTGGQLLEYLEKGCVFLPASGGNVNTWLSGGIEVYFWSATSSNYAGRYLSITPESIVSNATLSKTNGYLPVRLVRP